MSELVHIPTRKYRSAIPDAHRASLDTRILWMWNQRFGTIQTIWQATRAGGDVLDHTAATLFLQAIMANDLDSISLILQRIEGGSITDDEQLERTSAPTAMRV